MDNTHLEDLVPYQTTPVGLEIARLLAEMGVESGAFALALEATERVFAGDYPGYRASNTSYHDLEHTLSVALAMGRLLHGAWCEGVIISPARVELGMIAALFHDVGLIQEEHDHEGTGAKYTVGHERRSSGFMQLYLTEHGYPLEALLEARRMIDATILVKPVAEIDYVDQEAREVGQMLGTADLMAQMAERTYLEKLLLLYREFEEAKIPGFNNELELLEKTDGFYNFVARRRLDDDLGGMDRYFLPHLRRRWGIERDLYNEQLQINLEYLRGILREDKEGYRQRLRRGGIIERLDHQTQ